MKDNITTVNLKIDEETKKKLQKEADEKEMSLSGLIRLVLKEHLKGK